MQEHDKCVDVIDELHKIAHDGAFENMDASILTKATEVLI